MTTTTLSYRAIHSKIYSVNFIKINLKLIYFLAVLFSLIMLIFYIFRVNELTQGAYLIKNYNKEISSLLAENRNLQTNFAESSFLGLAQERAKELNFEKTTDVKYIQILQSSLAEANQNSPR